MTDHRAILMPQMLYVKQGDWRIENLYGMICLPFVILSLAVVLEYSGFDVWWVSHFFDAEHCVWLYKEHWLLSDVIHIGGQVFDKIVIATCLVGYIFISLNKKFHRYRKIVLFFIVATVVGPLVVGLGKTMTHIYTPWDLQRFNGTYPYIRLFDPVAPGAAIGHAFPAGHASGGYCFLSLYFVLLHIKSSYRVFGIVFGLLLGMIFGVAQHIRGAHFPSHDLVTLAICWYASLTVYILFYFHNNALWRMAKNSE